jgi:hypothetical protein
MEDHREVHAKRPGEMSMTRFSVGEQVIIRFGRPQGKKAVILKSLPADVYKVKVENGSVLFFTGKGLERKMGAMTPKKTLEQRQKELQLLLADPAGRKELQALVSKYHASSGKLKPPRTSVITYLLVHERERGLISN